MRSRPASTAIAIALVIALALGLLLLLPDADAPGGASRDAAAVVPARDATTTTAAPRGPLTFRIDDSLVPFVDEVEPIDGTDTPRSVGVYAAAGARPAELVLDEVMVHVADDAELDGFLERWDGSVLDSFAPEADGSRDHLVRVDVSLADPDDLADDLLAYEPEHAGEHRVSDARVLRLLSLAASEWADGTEVVLDWLTESSILEDIQQGHAYEESPKNVFEWSYMRSGGAMDTGVAEAWKLLDQYAKLVPSLTFMLRDGGFNPNADFPRNYELKNADWGEKNPGHCTGGSDCPWHGTDVIQAGIGKVDNDFGVAGPGGPVADSVIAIGNSLDYWTQLRRLEKHAEQRHPAVVNLSFGREVNAGKSHARYWTDRRMGHIQDAGALVVAAAGNDGKSVDGDSLILPCESKNVLCVGGYGSDAVRSGGSNYGEGDSRTSVEIWGPMCVQVLNDPSRPMEDRSNKRTCGTSIASPFVGGVAMLVKAADPSLSPGQIRDILNQTAHVGGLGSEVTGSQRRIDALSAVAAALDVDVADPTVTIDSIDDGDEFPVGQWVDLDATAVDFAGRSVEVSWSSDVDGDLAEGNASFTETLSVGSHVITASATDTTGRTGTASVQIEITDTPPDVDLIAPAPGLEVWEGSDVALVAKSLDPDNWASVPDEDVEWVVSRNGVEVFVADGHKRTLPGAEVVAGTYDVEFTAGGVTVEASFVAKTPVPGMMPPTAHITSPEDGHSLGVESGKKTVSFSGTGTDPEDGALSGTGFRWTATNGSETIVLCEGSNVPGASGGGGGGLAVFKDCASFDGELGIGDGDVQFSEWTVHLVVFDSTGQASSQDTVTVTVNVVIP